MAPVHKRIALACDKCSRSRTRCDGGHPWPTKKRGRRRNIQNSTETDTNTSTVENPLQSSWSIPHRNDSPSFHFGYLSPANHEDSPARSRSRFSQTPVFEHYEPTVQAFTINHDSNSRDSQPQRPSPNERREAPIVSSASAVDSQSDPAGRPGTQPISNQPESALDHRKPYGALKDLMPLLNGILDLELAYELLDVYFTEPDGAWFRSSSPYVLNPVIRKEALTRTEKSRPISSALLVTILWTVTQTVASSALLRPGTRTQLSSQLQDLALSLFHDRDVDHWHRYEGHLIKKEFFADDLASSSAKDNIRLPQESVDDLLTLILFTVVNSAGSFKNDALYWEDKAIRLAKRLGLNRLDSCTCVGGLGACNPRTCSSVEAFPRNKSFFEIETEEEARRAFWLLFALDRHLSLSWNRNISIPDDECLVFQPLPEDVWTRLDRVPLSELPPRHYGPSTTVCGVGFFEYFLPLMTILGDVINAHHRQYHPRFGHLNQDGDIQMIAELLETCSKSLNDWAQSLKRPGQEASPNFVLPMTAISPSTPQTWLDERGESTESHGQDPQRRRKSRLVILYSRFILHVLYVLLYGKWDAISMLEPQTNMSHSHVRENLPLSHPQKHQIGEWIASDSFATCASHAISASEILSELLDADPELSFTPYLFGIYLLHGSFILLLFADRIPMIGYGRNESVEKACETIIRAHEVCVVTLPTDFQKRFRGILRATLYSVRETIIEGSKEGYTGSQDTHSVSVQHNRGLEAESQHERAKRRRKAEMFRARRELFDLYRWTNGSQGLAAL